MNNTVKRIAMGLATTSLAVAGLTAGAAMAQTSGAENGASASASAAPNAANQGYANQGYANQGYANHASGGHGGEWHRHEAGQRFLSLFRQLGLSANQKSQIKSILADARAARQKNAGERQAARAQMAALANPGDPSYATALQAAKTRAADAIQRRSDLQVSLYNVLTPQQKAQLTQAIVERRAEHAASLSERHGSAAATT